LFFISLWCAYYGVVLILIYNDLINDNIDSQTLAVSVFITIAHCRTCRTLGQTKVFYYFANTSIPADISFKLAFVVVRKLRQQIGRMFYIYSRLLSVLYVLCSFQKSQRGNNLIFVELLDYCYFCFAWRAYQKFVELKNTGFWGLFKKFRLSEVFI